MVDQQIWDKIWGSAGLKSNTYVTNTYWAFTWARYCFRWSTFYGILVVQEMDTTIYPISYTLLSEWYWHASYSGVRSVTFPTEPEWTFMALWLLHSKVYGSDTMWVLRLVLWGWYTFHVCLLEYSLLEPSLHAAKKPMPRGESRWKCSNQQP